MAERETPPAEKQALKEEAMRALYRVAVEINPENPLAVADGMEKAIEICEGIWDAYNHKRRVHYGGKLVEEISRLVPLLAQIKGGK